MPYVLIPVGINAAEVGDLLPGFGSNDAIDRDRAALGRILERVVLTSELLVTYAVALAGKPSPQ